MSNGSGGKDKADWWARGLGFFSLVIALGTFAYEHLRGPDLRTSTGKYVYIQGHPRIGVPVGFYNDGAKVAIVNSGIMILKDGSNNFLFRLTLFSPSTDKWTTPGSGSTIIPTTFSLFSQIIIKPGDASDGVFWYSPDIADFKFAPEKRYIACLNFEESDTASCKLQTTFHVETNVASGLGQQPEVIHPTRTDQ